jgi:KR domain
VHVQDQLALRVVEYLLSIPDLTLKLEASDATSQESTACLLDKIPIALGGCMLLSVVLSDRMFAFQNDSNFTKVFAPKTGTYNTLERCIPGGLSSLDFFVAFSSVVGLFGNAGQTNYSRCV